ncbi:MAG: hypothetical protein WCD12_09520 [Candidatus Binatus sp.]|uniref:hypothetical protein n=1 Tax=Candidatus Binatus sp. TaxID=2811406 RepID=UPI003C76BE4C
MHMGVSLRESAWKCSCIGHSFYGKRFADRFLRTLGLESVATENNHVRFAFLCEGDLIARYYCVQGKWRLRWKVGPISLLFYIIGIDCGKVDCANVLIPPPTVGSETFRCCMADVSEKDIHPAGVAKLIEVGENAIFSAYGDSRPLSHLFQVVLTHSHPTENGGKYNKQEIEERLSVDGADYSERPHPNWFQWIVLIVTLLIIWCGVRLVSDHRPIGILLALIGWLRLFWQLGTFIG